MSNIFFPQINKSDRKESEHEVKRAGYPWHLVPHSPLPYPPYSLTLLIAIEMITLRTVLAICITLEERERARLSCKVFFKCYKAFVWGVSYDCWLVIFERFSFWRVKCRIHRWHCFSYAFHIQYRFLFVFSLINSLEKNGNNEFLVNVYFLTPHPLPQ